MYDTTYLDIRNLLILSNLTLKKLFGYPDGRYNYLLDVFLLLLERLRSQFDNWAS